MSGCTHTSPSSRPPGAPMESACRKDCNPPNCDLHSRDQRRPLHVDSGLYCGCRPLSGVRPFETIALTDCPKARSLSDRCKAVYERL